MSKVIRLSETLQKRLVAYTPPGCFTMSDTIEYMLNKVEAKNKNQVAMIQVDTTKKRRRRIMVFNGSRIKVPNGYLEFERVIRLSGDGFHKGICRIVKFQWDLGKSTKPIVKDIIEMPYNECRKWLDKHYKLLVTINLSINAPK